MTSVRDPLRPASPAGRRARRGFTLVELLLAVSLMSLLAATTLFAMWGASERGKEARVQSQIAKIDFYISQKWETYKTRRVVALIPGSVRNPRLRAYIRLADLRELQRVELPERKADVMNPPTLVGSFPAPYIGYLRRCAQALGVDGSGAPLWSNWTPEHQSAECLYLILSQIRDGDRSGLEFLQPNEIGDTDGDGMREVLDPWKTPIAFLRWAPGYVTNPPVSWNQVAAVSFQMVNHQALNNNISPDPFDPLRADPRWTDSPGNPPPTDPTMFNQPYSLQPLIYSAGPDKRLGVQSEIFDGSGNPTVNHTTISVDLQAAAQGPGNLWTLSTFFYTNDPFATFDDGSGGRVRMGTPDGIASGDNITNHYREAQ